MSLGKCMIMTMLTERTYQQQYCTNSYNQAKNDRIPPFQKVNYLKQTIDNRKSIGGVINPGL
jgi:hypothetical protein